MTDPDVPVDERDACRILQEFYRERGHRPSCGDLRELDRALRRRGTSLFVLCNDMGFPETYRTQERGWTRRKAQEKVFQFHASHGRRPSCKEMGSLPTWLKYHLDETLSDFCNEIGIPEDQPLRTRDSIRADVQAFYDEHGHRPTQRDFKNHDDWLQKQGSSISRMCDEMGLVGDRFGRRRRRSEKEIEQRVRAFYTEHGRRPTQADLPGDNRWLHRILGSSLPKLCDAMGFPRSPPTRRRPPARIMEAMRTEIREFFDQHDPSTDPKHRGA